MLRFLILEQNSNGTWSVSDILEPLPRYRARICRFARGLVRSSQAKGIKSFLYADVPGKRPQFICGDEGPSLS